MAWSGVWKGLGGNRTRTVVCELKGRGKRLVIMVLSHGPILRGPAAGPQLRALVPKTRALWGVSPSFFISCPLSLTAFRKGEAKIFISPVRFQE